MIDPSDQQAVPNNALLSVRALRTDFPIRRRFLGSRDGWCRAVDGVDLDIACGETLGLVGESGCGKTTLARTILRLVEPTSGAIRFDGMDVLAATGDRLRRLRRNMQVVFQDSLGSLDPRMTVGRSIEEPLLIHRVGSRRQRRERIEALLQQVGMRPGHAERYPHELSGGQRQRVNMARAIALGPKFLVCDEPVSALDGSVQAQVLGVLHDLKTQLGLTMLFISHDLAVVRNFCDRVAVMYLGKIVEIAAASDIFERAKHPYTMALRAAIPEPDPTRRRLRPALSGDVPAPTDHAVGCAFHPRCPFATESCRQEVPTLRAISGSSGTQLVACHHAEDHLLWEDVSTA